MDLSATILSWNTLQDTLDCVSRVHNELKTLNQRGVTTEMIVLDNHSDTPTQMALQRLCGVFKARYMSNDEPQGVAKNRNRLMDACKGSYQLHCDGDIVPGKTMIRKMYDRMIGSRQLKAPCIIWALVGAAGKDDPALKEIIFQSDIQLQPSHTINTGLYIADLTLIRSQNIRFDDKLLSVVGDRSSDCDFGYQCKDKGLNLYVFYPGQTCYHCVNSSGPSMGALGFGSEQERRAKSDRLLAEKWGAKIIEYKKSVEVKAGTIIQCGGVYNECGYSRMSKNIFQNLKNYDQYTISLEATDSQSRGVDEVSGNILWAKDSLHKLAKADIGIVMSSPRDQLLNSVRYRVAFTMQECTEFHPERTVPLIAKYNEAWYPSTSDAEKHQRAGIPIPCHVVPLGVDINRYKPGTKLALKNLSNRFIFLSVFGWSWRKAPDILCRAFLDEFSGRDDVVLLIAGVAAGRTRSDIINKCNQDVTEFRGATGVTGKPDIIIMDEVIPDAAMPLLYRMANCVVQISRGEGWGLPVSEAMACGIPCIVHNAHSHADFVNEDCVLLVETDGYPLCEGGKWRSPAHEGMKCWNPSYDQTRAQMRRAYSDPGLLERLGLAGRKQAEKLTWQNTAAIIDGHLQRILRAL